MTKPNISELVFFWILFATVGLLAFSIMSPYFNALFIAGVFSVAFHPVYRRMRTFFKKSETLAALLTVIVVLVVILVPLVFLSMILFQEVVDIYGGLQQPGSVIAQLDHHASLFETFVRGFAPKFQFKFDFSGYAVAGLDWAEHNLDRFFSGILEFAFETLLVVIAMFFFLRDGEKLREFAVKWSPLSDAYDEGIITKLVVAISSVVKGSLTTAVVQGTLVGIGFAIFAIPNPVLWGVAATIAALTPILGTAIITVPTGVMLILAGNLHSGIGILVWAVVPVGLIDNFLDPYFYGKGINVHPLLILLSVVGGLVYFGPMGFLAGPIILTFFFALLEIYPTIIRGRSVLKD